MRLVSGWNFVVYAGRARLPGDAFASIMPYLTICYLWDNLNSLWVQVADPNPMVPYGCYFVQVTQDCVWDYGPDETPPAGVHLYPKASADGLTHLVNLVPYCGPTMPVEQAVDSIMSLVIGVIYFDNMQQLWLEKILGDLMVENTPYGIWVTKDCEWFFPVIPAPTVGQFTITDYARV